MSINLECIICNALEFHFKYHEKVRFLLKNTWFFLSLFDGNVIRFYLTENHFKLIYFRNVRFCIFWTLYLLFFYHSLSSFKVALGKSKSEGHKALVPIPQGGLKFTRTDCQHNGLIFRASGNRQHTPLKPFLGSLESKAFLYGMGRLWQIF